MDKPKCYGEYFKANPKACRACPVAQECKKVKPKKIEKQKDFKGMDK